MKVKIEREREYHVTIIDSSGKKVLEFFGIVFKKEQTKGLLGISEKVEEILHVKDFDFKIYPPFQVAKIPPKQKDPASWNIDEATITNTNFREVIFTGAHAQLVLMCIQPGSEIGAEIHENVDQFFRVEKGQVEVQWGASLEYKALLSEGFAMMVPAKNRHNVINTGKEPCHLYTIYSPPNHPDGLVQKSSP